ncbi:MAG TPA: CHASE domain-containing protein [Gemmatimonadaceae bacterium]|nr:CHASE domain-containing protein [Gemmatimonadaceae bacterium]
MTLVSFIDAVAGGGQPGGRQRSTRVRARIPALVLVASLLLTAGAAYFAASMERERARADFRADVKAATDVLGRRLGLYAAVLEGANGLFAASGEVTKAEFEAYVRNLRLDARYPGAQGLGFARRVPPGEGAAIEQSIRAQGEPGFRIWPPDGRDEATAVLYLEPPDARNRAVLGYDMYTDPVRRTAMERARDLGTVAMSARVILKQEIDPGDVQPGFLIFAAVYEDGMPPRTADERRARLFGWVYMPFRARDLFEAMFPASSPLPVALRVYDGARIAPEQLLYDSRAGLPARRARIPRDTVAMDAFGERWTLVYTARPEGPARRALLLPAAILLIGVPVSFLLWAVTRAEVRARRRTEQSEAIRSRFYAAMSHELRTPLNAILGYNDLLLDGVYGELSAPQRRGITRSQNAARHLLDVVNDVLDLSKLEAGKVELEDEDVAISSLVHDLFTTMHRLAEEAGVAMHLECECSTKRIRTDPRRLRQILLNLLSNAIKFGTPNPVIVRCALTPEGGVRIAVADRGPGIPPEDQERIFEEFVQLPNMVRGGTGLGLPISRRLATLLGGTLQVVSAPGEGATFELVLPPTRPGAPLPRPVSPPPAATR